MSEHRVREFRTNHGAVIYQLPMLVFHDFWAYAFLIHVDDKWILVDTGSGFHPSNDHLREGFKVVSDLLGRDVGFEDLSYVLITHGHIDHFGGLPYVRERSSAKVGVHQLDLRNLTNIAERLTLVSRRLNEFLVEAGLDDASRKNLIQIHKLSKLNYSSTPVDFSLFGEDNQIDGLEILHVPGHCPGQVVIRLGDVLLSADHVLSKTSPHQSPERITFNTGLAHYLESLELTRNWANGVSITLGSHEDPVKDLPGRIAEIQGVHRDRLDKILTIIKEPMSIYQVSEVLFGEVSGYEKLLALEEAGAHVEYLCQRGQLGIANYEEIDQSQNAIPWKYYRL